MIRRPPRSTLSSSSAASDVYKRQVLTGLGLDQGLHGDSKLTQRVLDLPVLEHLLNRDPSGQVAGGSSPQQRAGYTGDADHARASVGADHRSDLGDEDRLGAKDLAPALHQALGLLVSLDVLDDPAIGSVVVELVHVLDH